MNAPSFAYLFERFPSFVQTFVYREATEMVRQGMQPWLISLRRPDDRAAWPGEEDLPIFYVPEEKILRAEVDRQIAGKHLPRPHLRALSRARASTDSQRVFEAVWLGPKLREKGIRHIHAHFAGLAARTAWWIEELFGIGYSFTGHANDIFCETDFPISNAQLIDRARLIVTESDFARRWVEEKYPKARGKTHRVFNGIELHDFLGKKASPDIPLIVSVGRAVKKKGFGDLIEACRMLRESGVAFRCEIVGDGPLLDGLSELIAQKKLSETVHLRGALQQPEVRALLASATLFALACVPEAGGGMDNLPTVIMEAMATGLPIVSTQLAGIPEMISDGIEGFLVEPGAPAALAEAFARILLDPEQGEKMGARARQVAEKQFAIAQTTRNLKQLLVAHTEIYPPQEAQIADPGWVRKNRPGWRRFFRF